MELAQAIANENGLLVIQPFGLAWQFAPGGSVRFALSGLSQALSIAC